MSFPYKYKIDPPTDIYTIDRFVRSVEEKVGGMPAVYVSICMGHFMKTNSNEKRNYKITFCLNDYITITFSVKGGWGRGYKTWYKYENRYYYKWENSIYSYKGTLDREQEEKLTRALESSKKNTRFYQLKTNLKCLEY